LQLISFLWTIDVKYVLNTSYGEMAGVIMASTRRQKWNISQIFKIYLITIAVKFHHDVDNMIIIVAIEILVVAINFW